MSPSIGACAGRIARASPSLAMMASRFACALLRLASVATSAMVVVVPGPPLSRGASAPAASGGPAPVAELRPARTGGPEPRSVADQRRAYRVHRHDGADGVAGGGARRGRAEPALDGGRGGAGAGAHRAEREGARPGRPGGRVAEVAVGREPAPILVAPVQQVEQDGAAGQRHQGAAQVEAASVLAERRLDAAGGVQPEHRAAGQHHGVDGPDGRLGGQHVDIPPAGCSAQHGNRHHGRTIEQDRGHSGAQREVGGMADRESGNIGDEVEGHVHSSPGQRGIPIGRSDRDRTLARGAGTRLSHRAGAALRNALRHHNQ